MISGTHNATPPNLSSVGGSDEMSTDSCVVGLICLLDNFRQHLKHFVRWLLSFLNKNPPQNNNPLPRSYSLRLHLIMRRVTVGTFEEKLSDAALCFPPRFVWFILPRCCLRWEQSLPAPPWSVAVSMQPRRHGVRQMNLADDLKPESLTLPNHQKLHFFPLFFLKPHYRISIKTEFCC